jgi:hypothetical protein
MSPTASLDRPVLTGLPEQLHQAITSSRATNLLNREQEKAKGKKYKDNLQ